eukprot:9696951-Alexandrium_andersonii.AAC.1
MDRGALWQLAGEGQFSPKRAQPSWGAGSDQSTPIQQQAKRGRMQGGAIQIQTYLGSISENPGELDDKENDWGL